MSDLKEFLDGMFDELDLIYITFLTEENLEDTPINRAAFYQSVKQTVAENPTDDSFIQAAMLLRLTLKIMTWKNQAVVDALNLKKR